MHSASTAARNSNLKWLVALLWLGASAVFALRQIPPTEDWLAEYANLATLASDTSREITPVLFVPLGAMLVVFARRTLGLRIMGPFRSILLAVAFQVTGLVVGTAFLALTVLSVSTIRPAARKAGLGYYGRITVMLSSVAVMMACAVMLGHAWNWNAVQSIAHFPIVVLCLVADAFSRTKEKEGLRSATWRVFVTAVVALPLAFVSEFDGVVNILTSYPELLFAQIGLILVFSEFMNWNLLEWMNPTPIPATATNAAVDPVQPTASISILHSQKSHSHERSSSQASPVTN